MPASASLAGSAPPAPHGPDRRGLLLSGLMALGAPGLLRGAAADSWQAHVLLLRHAEKETGDDPGLTLAGQRTADALAALLAAARVTHLEHSPFRRTRETLAPLAQRTGIEPQLTDPQDVEGLRRRILALPDGAVAVIAGHSNTLPGAIVALGGSIGDLDESGNIRDDVYDRLFVITWVRSGEQEVTASTLELRLPRSG